MTESSDDQGHGGTEGESENTNIPPELGAAFVITSAELEPVSVIQLHGIRPTRIWRIGDPIGRSILRRKKHGWELKVPKRETYDLEEVVCELLALFEGKEELLRQTCRDFRLGCMLSCVAYVRQVTPAIYLSYATLSRIHAIGADIDVDLIMMAP